MKNMKNERVQIFIDGGNFFHLALKKIGLSETEFDFDAFANFLADGRDVSSQGKRYYIGTVRERAGDPYSVQQMARQTTLFSALQKNNWQIKTSKLRERRENIIVDHRVENADILLANGINEIHYTRNREKGIDVKIVTDLLIGAIDDKYDTAIIVSSDTDLVPAIDSLRNRLHKKVEYIGFSITDTLNTHNSSRPILAMIPRTDTQRTFIESDLRQFMIPNLFKNKEKSFSKK